MVPNPNSELYVVLYTPEGYLESWRALGDFSPGCPMPRKPCASSLGEAEDLLESGLGNREGEREGRRERCTSNSNTFLLSSFLSR